MCLSFYRDWLANVSCTLDMSAYGLTMLFHIVNSLRLDILPANRLQLRSAAEDWLNVVGVAIAVLKLGLTHYNLVCFVILKYAVFPIMLETDFLVYYYININCSKKHISFPYSILIAFKLC